MAPFENLMHKSEVLMWEICKHLWGATGVELSRGARRCPLRETHGKLSLFPRTVFVDSSLGRDAEKAGFSSE